MNKLGGPLGVLGGVLDLVGVGLIVLGITASEANRFALVGGGAVVCVLGVAFVLAGRLPGSTDASPIADPVEAMGRIVTVRERGPRRSAAPSIVELGVSVECVETLPYQAELRAAIGPAERDLLVPGARVPIVFERSDPSRVERDVTRDVRRAR